MIPQDLEETTHRHSSTEPPALSNSLPRWEAGAKMRSSLPKWSDQRTHVDLHYSANGPDMFALVSSIVEQQNEPEAVTDWDSQPKSFSRSCSIGLEDDNRYSNLFPLTIWDPEIKSNTLEVESLSSGEEIVERTTSTELISRKLDDPQVTSSWPPPSPPWSPPTRKFLNPRNKGFTREGLNRQPSAVPGRSNGNKQVEDIRRSQFHFSSPIWIEFCRKQRGSVARGELGASGPEKPTQLSRPAIGGVCAPAIQENDLGAKRCTYESPQLMSPLASPFLQWKSIPEEAAAGLPQYRQQNRPNNLSIFLSNAEREYLMSSHQDSFCCGDKCLQSGSFDPLGASSVIYKKTIDKKPVRTDAEPCGPPGHDSAVQPFGSQAAPRNGGFPSRKGNPKLYNYARCSWDDLEVPRRERWGETSRNVSSRGWPPHPSANRFAKSHGLDNAPGGGSDGRKRERMRPGSVDLDETQLEALRTKKKLDFLLDFINASFLPFFPLAVSCHKFPKPSEPHPPHPPSPPSPRFSVNRHYDNAAHSSHFTNDQAYGGAAVTYPAISPPVPPRRLVTNHGGAGPTLSAHLQGCYYQWRALERERTKIEADLAMVLPGTAFICSNEMVFHRLPANPSRVDRLVWSQFQERANVCALLEKMEYFWGISIHSNIWAALEHHLEAIHTTRARRRAEILNSVNPQRPWTTPYFSKEEDIMALAMSLKELTASTRKCRTALWCAYQHILLPKILSIIAGEDAADPASISLQTKMLTEGEEEENE